MTDPEPRDVQENGFEMFADEWNLPDGVIETFMDRKFDERLPFNKNAIAFWKWLSDPAEEVVTECPKCGEPTEGAVVRDEQIVVQPCGHVLGEVDEEQIIG